MAGAYTIAGAFPTQGGPGSSIGGVPDS